MSQHAGRNRAFSLTELLVVIGIIAVLMGILFPIIGHMRRNAELARSAMDLQAIVTALEQYKSDIKEYPPVVATDPVTAGSKGARTLVLALLGPQDQPQDGQDGPGFRMRAGGKVYGPYLQPGKFKISRDSTPYTQDSAGNDIEGYAFLTSDGNPILYFPAHGSPSNITQANGFLATDTTYAASVTPLYNFADNNSTDLFANVKMMQLMMGDLNTNGKIDSGETPATTGPYLLWSPGLDGIFGPLKTDGSKLGTPPTTDTEKKQAIERSDDVTNFQR